MESSLLTDAAEAHHARHHRRSVVLAGVSGTSKSEARRGARDQTRVTASAQRDGAGVEGGGGLPRRALLGAAGGFLLSTGCSLNATTTPPAVAAPSAPAPPFCGVAGKVVPQWAYRTDFDQFLIDFNGFKTYVRTVGSPPKKGLLPILSSNTSKLKPALVIHGGPGLSSAYLESLELLAAEGRQIIFYDQIGCGKSFQGSNYSAPKDYSVDLFLSELDTVRSVLNLDDTGVHLIGHGWGGILALAACSRPDGCRGVASLSLISTPPSTAALISDRADCVRKLPTDVQEALMRGPSSDPSYSAAVAAYRAEFVNRRPAQCVDAALGRSSQVVYSAMCGPDFLASGGELASWDATPELSKLASPTLVMRGEFDEVSQASADVLLRGAPNARGVVCLGSGSYCHLDNPETALGELNDFMSSADNSDSA